MSLFKLSNLKVSFQIGLISIVSVIGLFIVINGYIMQSDKIEGLQKEYVTASEQLTVIDEVSYLFLNARRNEKDFLIRKNLKYVNRHRANDTKINEAIANVVGFYNDDKAKQLEAVSLGDTYKRYQGRFEEVAKTTEYIGIDEKSGLLGKLRGAVKSIEDEVNNYNEAEIVVSMLMQRRAEKDYLARKSLKYVERLKKENSKMISLIKGSTKIPAEAKKDLVKKSAIYLNSFVELAENMTVNEKNISSLSKLFAESTPILLALSDSVKNNFAELQREQVRVKEKLNNMINMIVAIILLSVVSLSYLIGRGISSSIVDVNNSMDELAKGNLEVEIEAQDRKDEVGDMYRSLVVFKKNALECQRLEEEQKENEKRAVAEKKRLMNEMADNFEKSVGCVVQGVSSASVQMKNSAQSMAATAEQTSQQSSSVATASEEASANVQMVATAAEELSSSINEISSQISETSRIANDAAERANYTQGTIEELVTATQRISEVIEMITEIAEQTNLLALNATIEAARAGEMGKGFAVVASEVKALATQTAKATDEITEQISSVQNTSKNAAEAISGIKDVVLKVNELSSAVASAVEEQDASTKEIAMNVQQAAAGTEAVNSNISGVQQAASETGRASGEMVSVANDLTKQSDELTREVNKFLKQVREG